MKKAGIIGYGRFGRVLADLLTNKYEVRVYDIEAVDNDEGVEICSLSEVLECILVFIAVPIRSFEEVIKEGKDYHYNYFREGQKIPKVINMLSGFFNGKEPSKNINPDDFKTNIL